MAAMTAAEHHLDTVVLTGGVFQNARLTEIVESGLDQLGLVVLVHATIPPNDGGISVGQAAIAAFSGDGAGEIPRPVIDEPGSAGRDLGRLRPRSVPAMSWVENALIDVSWSPA